MTEAPEEQQYILVEPEAMDIPPDAFSRWRMEVQRASRTDIIPPWEIDFHEDQATSLSRLLQMYANAGRIIPELSEEAAVARAARERAGTPLQPWEETEEPETPLEVALGPGLSPIPPVFLQPEIGPRQMRGAGVTGAGGGGAIRMSVGPRRVTFSRTNMTGRGAEYTRPLYTQQYSRLETIKVARLRDPNDLQTVIRATSARHERHFAATDQYFGHRVGQRAGNR